MLHNAKKMAVSTQREIWYYSYNNFEKKGCNSVVVLSYRMCDYVMYMNRIFFCHVALLKSRVIIVQV